MNTPAQLKSESGAGKPELLNKVFMAAGIGIVLLYIVGVVNPSWWNWGVHHFGFLPLFVSVPAIVIMVLALLPSVQLVIVSKIKRFSGQIFHNGAFSGYLFSFVTLAAAGTLFWVGNAKTSLLGDGSMVLRTLPTFPGTEHIPSTAFHNEPLVSFILITIDKFLSSLNFEPSHQLAYQIVALASGVGAIAILMFFSRKLFRETIDRVVFSLFVLASGGSALFFGYIENYSPTYTAVLLYCITGTAFLRKELNPLVPSVAFGILFSCHFGMVVFFPSLIYIVYSAWRSKGAVAAVSCLAAAVLTGAALLWVSGYSLETFLDVFLKSEKHLLPVTGSVGDYQAYTLFSWAHVLDVSNLLLLISPFAVVIILAGIVVLWRNIFREDVWRFLFLITGCTLGFVIVVNATLGMSRDWDLLAPLILGVAFSAGIILFEMVQLEKISRRMVTGLTLITFCSTAGWVTVNAREESAVARFEHLEDTQLWGRIAVTNAFEELAVYYRTANNIPKSLEYLDKFIALDSLNARIWSNRGMAFVRLEGDVNQKIRSFNKAIDLGLKQWIVYLNLGVSYGEHRQFREALDAFDKALELNPRSEVVLNNIGLTQLKLRRPCSVAIPYFLKAISEQPQYPQPYRNAALCYIEIKDFSSARTYLEKYRQIAPNDPNISSIERDIVAGEK